MNIATFPDDYILIGQQNGSGTFFVYEPIRCNWNGYKISVPAGTKSDLASAPRPFRKSGKWNRAAILHDYVYRGGNAKRALDNKTIRLSKADADQMFLDAMTALNVDARRFIMFAGVKCFSWASWKKI